VSSLHDSLCNWKSFSMTLIFFPLNSLFLFRRVLCVSSSHSSLSSYAQQLNEANQSATLMSTQLEVVSREKVAVERDLKAKQDEVR